MFDDYSVEFSSCETALDTLICDNMVVGFTRQAELIEYYFSRVVEALVLILIFLALYVIIRWLFNLIADIALGW